MIFEYDFEYVLSKTAFDSMEMGLVEPDSILDAIKKVLNERAKKGWEPIAPFTLPIIWFKKTKK